MESILSLPILSILCVISKVLACIRAAAAQASQPACPPPMTITSQCWWRWAESFVASGWIGETCALLAAVDETFRTSLTLLFGRFVASWRLCLTRWLILMSFPIIILIAELLIQEFWIDFYFGWFLFCFFFVNKQSAQKVMRSEAPPVRHIFLSEVLNHYFLWFMIKKSLFWCPFKAIKF